jgi:hypothetical protein
MTGANRQCYGAASTDGGASRTCGWMTDEFIIGGRGRQFPIEYHEASRLFCRLRVSLESASEDPVFGRMIE